MNFGRNASVMRIRQGAPGVICSPSMNPSLSQRWTVEVATPSISAACLTLTSSPSVVFVFGLKRGMFQWRRRLPTRLLVKGWP